jgi:hypothetical protein
MMSDAEKEQLVHIQRMQMYTSNPFVDDYYFMVLFSQLSLSDILPDILPPCWPTSPLPCWFSSCFQTATPVATDGRCSPGLGRTCPCPSTTPPCPPPRPPPAPTRRPRRRTPPWLRAVRPLFFTPAFPSSIQAYSFRGCILSPDDSAPLGQCPRGGFLDKHPGPSYSHRGRPVSPVPRAYRPQRLQGGSSCH